MRLAAPRIIWSWFVGQHDFGAGIFGAIACFFRTGGGIPCVRLEWHSEHCCGTDGGQGNEGDEPSVQVADLQQPDCERSGNRSPGMAEGIDSGGQRDRGEERNREVPLQSHQHSNREKCKRSEAHPLRTPIVPSNPPINPPMHFISQGRWRRMDFGHDLAGITGVIGKLVGDDQSPGHQVVGVYFGPTQREPLIYSKVPLEIDNSHTTGEPLVGVKLDKSKAFDRLLPEVVVMFFSFSGYQLVWLSSSNHYSVTRETILPTTAGATNTPLPRQLFVANL